MKTKNVLPTLRVRMALIAMALFAIGIIGCADSKTESQPGPNDNKTTNSVAQVDPVKKTEPVVKSEHKDSDTIDGFWCEPHGLPEDECWKCSRKFRMQCEKDGDWCKEHQRPNTQCFKCDPKLIDKWAKVYEERTGKKAPKPEPY